MLYRYKIRKVFVFTPPSYPATMVVSMHFCRVCTRNIKKCGGGNDVHSNARLYSQGQDEPAATAHRGAPGRTGTPGIHPRGRHENRIETPRGAADRGLQGRQFLQSVLSRAARQEPHHHLLRHRLPRPWVKPAGQPGSRPAGHLARRDNRRRPVHPRTGQLSRRLRPRAGRRTQR